MQVFKALLLGSRAATQTQSCLFTAEPCFFTVGRILASTFPELWLIICRPRLIICLMHKPTVLVFYRLPWRRRKKNPDQKKCREEEHLWPTNPGHSPSQKESQGRKSSSCYITVKSSERQMQPCSQPPAASCQLALFPPSQSVTPPGKWKHP